MQNGFWNLEKIIHWLFCLFLFLLPWQTRFIFEPRYLNGGFWEYGSGSWYATEVLLWLIIVLSCVDLIKRKELWQRIKTGQGRKRRVIFGLIAICYLLFTIFNSISPVISFNFVFRLIGAACLFVVLVPINQSTNPDSSSPESRILDFAPQQNRDKLITAFWFGGVVQGLLALWQFFSQKIIHLPFSGIAPHLPQDLGAFVIEVGDERWLRAYGAFGSPNILGGFLAIIFLLGLVLYLKSKPGWGRIALAIGQVIVTVGLVLSFSRAAWVAAVVGSVLMVGVLFKQKESRFALIRPVLFSVITVVVLFVAFKPLFLVRTQSIGRLEKMSLGGRLEQFGEWSKTFFQHPLLGVGPGAYTFALYKNNPTLPVWRYQPIHNIYLLILAELGIVGFSGVLVFLCSGLSAQAGVLMIWRRNRLFLPIIASILILGLFDHWLWSMYIGLIVVALVLGLSTART